MPTESGNIIRLQILKSECADFNLTAITVSEAKKLTQKVLDFDVEINVASNLKEKQIKLETAIVARKKNRKGMLFSINAISVFHTEDIEKVINNNNGIIAPEDFMRKVINISIGGVRGMLAIKLADTPLNHITLPLLDTGSLKQD